MQKKRLLVIEDNEIERKMLCEILRKEYQVIEASNGLEALKMLKEKLVEPRLILLDIRMPVMDGHAFLKELNKDVQLSAIPVIILTVSDCEEDESLAWESGAADFITKPYRPSVILRRVSSLLRLQETTAMMQEVQYDKLTGLYNKEAFYHKVRELLDENPDTEYTVLCSNLENFKLYNDVFGWKAGDELLIQVANTLRERVGEYGICCRYSADRFLFLLEKSLEVSGRERFNEVRKTKRSELTDRVTSKVGAYEVADRTLSVEQMCDRAILAVESIKGLYNQHYAVYSDTVRKKLHRERKITDTMVTALNERQFVLYFQPKYSLNDKCIIGAEALVRWNHPELGFLSPAEFIPLFEKNGFIYNLDFYVWELACEHLKSWKENGYSLLPISVNVSRADFYMADLTEIFNGLVAKYDIPASLLHLEITESAYIANSSDRIINTVLSLRENGFIIEMDDFGSGYSSLNMFSQMSVDVLKLDMKFISNELSKPMEKSILSDVINMAHRMQLDVVAEGVETGNQIVRLKSVGCDCAQGYYFAKPMPGEELGTLLLSRG